MHHAGPMVEYHFVHDLVVSQWADSHARVLELLEAATNANAISSFDKRERADALPQNEADNAMLDACRDFAMRRHVRLCLGSRRNRYGWFPPQLLIVRDGDRIEAVLPFEIEGRLIGLEEFLEALLRGEAWTVVLARERADRGPHRKLVDAIVADANCLEGGLVLVGQNAWVADGTGETGYVDLVFTDSAGRYLLVEVKVGAGEIDQGIGQLLKQGIMFARQNFLDDKRVRLALACPDITPVRRAACARAMIECFHLSATVVR